MPAGRASWFFDARPERGPRFKRSLQTLVHPCSSAAAGRLWWGRRCSPSHINPCQTRQHLLHHGRRTGSQLGKTSVAIKPARHPAFPVTGKQPRRWPDSTRQPQRSFPSRARTAGNSLRRSPFLCHPSPPPTLASPPPLVLLRHCVVTGHYRPFKGRCIFKLICLRTHGVQLFAL